MVGELLRQPSPRVAPAAHPARGRPWRTGPVKRHSQAGEVGQREEAVFARDDHVSRNGETRDILFQTFPAVGRAATVTLPLRFHVEAAPCGGPVLERPVRKIDVSRTVLPRLIRELLYDQPERANPKGRFPNAPAFSCTQAA